MFPSVYFIYLECDIGLDRLKGIGNTEKEWLLAASSGNLESMDALLMNDKELINSRDFVYGYSALHWASKLGRTEVVEFVVEKGESEYLTKILEFMNNPHYHQCCIVIIR